MSTDQADLQTPPFPLHRLMQLIATQGKDAARAQHGEFHLLHNENLRPLDGELQAVETLGIDSPPTQIVAELKKELTLVYPLERARRNGANVITIGRVPEADICIPDMSISRLHAELIEGPPEQWSIIDCGSTSGTYVGKKKIPSKPSLEAVALSPFAEICLGTVWVIFTDLAGLQAFSRFLMAG